MGKPVKSGQSKRANSGQNMATLFRWLLRLVSVAILLAVVGVSLAYYLASRSLPDYDKTLEVSGTAGDIEIVRDNAGVPHIFAPVDRDVFFGLGYVHASRAATLPDRLCT